MCTWVFFVRGCDKFTLLFIKGIRPPLNQVICGERVVSNMDGPRTSTFDELCHMSENEAEGVVLLGAGGDPNEWINGVLGMWKAEGISTSADLEAVLESALILKSTMGRTDIALLPKMNAVDISRMAMWRLRFGDCSWVSDFVVNYKSHY